MLHNVAYVSQISCFSYMLSLFIYLFCLFGWVLWTIFFPFFFCIFCSFPLKILYVAWFSASLEATPLSKGTSICIPCENILMYFIYHELHLFRLCIRCYRLSGIIKGKFCFLCCPFLLWFTRCFFTSGIQVFFKSKCRHRVKYGEWRLKMEKIIYQIC